MTCVNLITLKKKFFAVNKYEMRTHPANAAGLPFTTIVTKIPLLISFTRKPTFLSAPLHKINSRTPCVTCAR